jgi:tRNA pseudouridine38-40 synthase
VPPDARQSAWLLPPCAAAGAMTRQRYKLLIAYRGTSYHGWQTQSRPAHADAPDAPAAIDESSAERPMAPVVPAVRSDLTTVQSEMLRAIASVVHHPVKLIGSSRTDAGVHAKGQIAHFDTDRTQIPPESLRLAINARLPVDIVVHAITPVGDDFDAITSTRSKRYQYAIWNAPDRAPLVAELLWHRWQKLDRDAMKAAAARFVGTHDFASFARPGHGRSTTTRTIIDCDVSWRGKLLIVGVEGSGFLWHMVRIMVGTLVEVGLGRFDPPKIDAMIAARNRQAAGLTAPPHGLYLQWIKTTESPDGKPIAEVPGAEPDAD